MPRDLPDNLRLLCSYHHSIADVCRKLGMNRSQFNRYLNGQTLPSLRLMRKICDFFGVEEAELLMPHGQFKELVRLKPQGVGIEIDKNVIMFEAEKVIQDSRSKLDAYAGYYFSYYNSMSNPGKILKSLTKIYRTPFSMNIKTLEVIGEQNHDGFTCKYEGACFTLGDRLFITAMETLTRNEAIQIILYPSYTNRIRYLSGVMSGVAAHASRPPTATQIVLQFLGTNVDIRKSLGLCGLLLPGDDRIPADVQRMISGDLREGTHLLEAAPI
ncbi:helix-turn-helix domain-containing protein [Roseovarius albus]|nr:helix-turn-helix transcriptional regulator [Roseovarius albus]